MKTIEEVKEEIKVSGHDLLQIFKGEEGKFLFMEIKVYGDKGLRRKEKQKLRLYLSSGELFGRT